MKQFTLSPTILSALCEQLITYLKSIQMMPRTIDNYKSVLRKLQRFAAERGETIYCRELVDAFISENGFQERQNDPGHMYYRTGQMLHDLASGNVPGISYSRHTAIPAISDAWNSCVECYRNSLSAKNQSSSTIKTKLARLKDFLLFLMQQNVLKPVQLKPGTITDFIAHAGHRYKAVYRYNLFQSLKDFLTFLYLNSLVPVNFSLFFSSLPDPSDSVLPSFYSHGQIQQVLCSIERNTFMGKRDFAMVQMIAQTGIRAVDMANLQLGNLHPNSSEIRFQQHKTKKWLDLPLTEELWSSLYDYLSCRKEGQCQYLFVRATNARMAMPVTPSCISAVVKKYIHLSGVYSPGKKAGAHSLRHSLAVSMTNSGTPFPIISKALGHSSMEVTKEYAGISLEQLSTLALEVSIYER